MTEPLVRRGFGAVAASSVRRLAWVVAAAFVLSSCTSTEYFLYKKPTTPKLTDTRQELIDLPYPPEPVPVAVYNFADETGQFKPVPSGAIQTLSRALSQGGATILVQALKDAGHGRWFAVLEREHVDNLLKERQIITDTRARYLGETRINAAALPAMLFAGVLLEGGVIGYDSDVRTGGLGAAYLGIGADTQYRQDTISVYLRAVAVKTGEVLSSVVTRKTVDSISLDNYGYKFVAFKDLLEVEGGFSVNEPTLIALEQAIQKAVHDLVLDGANQGVWTFYDKAQAQPLIEAYIAERGYNTAQAVVPAAPAAQQPPRQPPGRQSSATPARTPAQPAVNQRSFAVTPPVPLNLPVPIPPVPVTPVHVISNDADQSPPAVGDYLQIGSFPSEEKAQKAWAGFAAHHYGSIGDRSPTIQAAKVNGAVVWRLRLGPYPSRQAAATACNSLKTFGNECFLIAVSAVQRQASAVVVPAAQISRVPADAPPRSSAPAVSGGANDNSRPQTPAGGEMVTAPGG